MKRWFVISCLAAISALGVLVPAAAQASAAPIKLTSGKPAKATVTRHGQQVTFTFTATKNRNVTFNVTHFDFKNQGSTGEVFLGFYEPGSSSEYIGCNNGVDANTYCNFTTPVGGTWKIVLSPYEDSVGSLTLTFANDVPTKALAATKPVTTTIKFAGQEAGYTFTATKNKNITFKVTRFNFTDDGDSGEVFLGFYEPGSSSEYIGCNNGVDANTYCNFTTPVGGTWKIVLVPYEASVGSLTLAYANDVPTKALTAGKPVTTEIKFPGQEAGYTFTATKNKNVSFKVTHFDFTDQGSTGEVFLDFYEPGSSSEYIGCNNGVDGNTTCSFKPPVGGTWTATLFPYEASIGSLTLTLN
jgi:hypothetical protein